MTARQISVRQISARRLITSTDTVEWPHIAISPDGIIEAIESGPPNGEETTLAAPFFDIHIHGAAGHDVMEATPEALHRIGEFLATKGITNFLATTVTAPVDRTLHSLEALATLIESAEKSDCHPDPEHREGEGPASWTSAATPVGIHLEGPFISHAKRGVHPPADIQPPSIPLFEKFQQAARGHIRLITLAPEIPGAIELIEYATKSGTKVSLGHSDATAAQTRAAIAAGAASATHTFNAMRRLDHREPGIAGVVLDSPALFAELICDGIHVAPEFVRLWLRAKGEDRAILVTDGISATGMPDGVYTLGGLQVAVANGRCLLASDLARGIETLAGSVLTMDRAIANLQRFTGAPLASAAHLATRNPARMLGLDHLAEPAPGRPADFNIFAPNGALRATFLHGREVPRTLA